MRRTPSRQWTPRATRWRRLDLVAESWASGGARRSELVPQGCCVLWSAFLIHGVEKIPRTSGLKVGMYLGYFKAGSRPEYARRTGGLEELDDRLQISSTSGGTHRGRQARPRGREIAMRQHQLSTPSQCEITGGPST